MSKVILPLHQRLLNKLWPSLISFRLSSVFQGPSFSKWAQCPPEPLLWIVSSSLPLHRESWIRESFACYFSKIHARSQCAKDRNCIIIQAPFSYNAMFLWCHYSCLIFLCHLSRSFHNPLRNSEGQNFLKKTLES